MNVLYEPESPTTGLDVSKLPGATTQYFACGYTSSDSAAGMYDSWVGEQIFGTHPMAYDPAGKIQSWGGAPQNLSLALHIETLQKAIQLTIPSDFDGVLALDYEGWQPVWDMYLYSGVKAVSEALVREAHPTWSNDTILVEATKEFEAAAKNYYLTTIKTLKNARPKMRVGFYETPFGGWHSYNDPEYAAQQQSHNNNLTWLWSAVDFLAPTIYLSDRGGENGDQNASNIRGLIGEAERIAAMIAINGGKRLPVIPFAWMRSSAKGNASFLPQADMKVEMAIPFEFPSTEAIIVWGDNAVGGVTMPAEQTLFRNVFLPIAQEAMKEHCQCAATMCSDHGRCVLNNTYCLCYEGYTGPNCSSPVEMQTVQTCSTCFERYCFLPNATSKQMSVFAPWTTYQSGCCKKCNETSGCKSWSYNVSVPGKSCTLFSEEGMIAEPSYDCVVSPDAHRVSPPPSPPSPHPPKPSPPSPIPTPPPTQFVPWPLPIPPLAPVPPGPIPATAVVCPDGVSYCPPSNTCGQLTTGMWACCPLPNATICGHAYCCPSGQLCDISKSVCYPPPPPPSTYLKINIPIH